MAARTGIGSRGPALASRAVLEVCAADGGHDAREVDSESSEDDAPIVKKATGLSAPTADSYWVVSDDDLRREFPGLLVFRATRAAPVYMTPLFFSEMCQMFYGLLNSRELRRHIAALYTANALAEQVRQHRVGTAPYSCVWCLHFVLNAYTRYLVSCIKF